MLRAFGNLSPPGHPGYLSGSYYSSDFYDSLAAGAVTAGRLYLTPHRIDMPVTVDRVVVSVTAGAAGNAKVGIYRINADGSATFVAENNADMSTAAAADLEGSFASNPTLAPGIYALASCYSATPTVRIPNNGVPSRANYITGAASAGGVTFTGGGTVTGWWTALAYVAGPTSFFPASIAAGSMTRDAFERIPYAYWRKA